MALAPHVYASGFHPAIGRQHHHFPCVFGKMSGARACAAAVGAEGLRRHGAETCPARSTTINGAVLQQQPRRVALATAAARPLRPAPRRQPPHPRQVSAAAGEQRGAVAVRDDAYQALQGCQVIQSSTQQPVELTSLWGEEERVVLVFGRSYG